MCSTKAENEMWLASFTELGMLHIENKIDPKKSFEINLFKSPQHYQYLRAEWLLVPQVFLTPNSKYVIATYGIGYVYFILLSEKRIEKFFRLFSCVNYEHNSFEEIDTCCYYDELTQVDFSNTGRYVAIRVRGNYDPQCADGLEVIFTPVYFRSIFIIDLLNLELCFYEDYNNVQSEYKNLASIAFSPNDNYIAMGALGTIVKVFCITSGECLGEFSSLVWISDSCGIRDCPLISFLDENNFVYVNKDSDIIKVSLQQNGQFVQSGIIKTAVPHPQAVDEELYDKWKYIKKIEIKENKILCYFVGFMNYQQQKTFKLYFDDINQN